MSQNTQRIHPGGGCDPTGQDEVTPPGWEPRQVPLKPGPALVGRGWEVWKPQMARAVA